MSPEELFEAVKQEEERFRERFEHLEDVLEVTARRNRWLENCMRDPDAESAALFLMDFEMTKLAANPGDMDCIVRLAMLVTTLANMSQHKPSIVGGQL